MKGVVIAIGGNERKRGDAAILRRFLERAGGAEARIVIIPSASVNPVRRAALYTKIFSSFGAGDIHVVHAERGAVSRDELMLVTNATGIFVTGGDQERLMKHLRSTGVADSIVDAVRNGAVYAGTSAGAAAISHRMIVGCTDENGFETVHFAEGLGLIPGVMVDQHFSERGRLKRLVEAVRKHQLIGVGIDEDTAYVWEPHGTEIAGSGSVTLVHPGDDDLALQVINA